MVAMNMKAGSQGIGERLLEEAKRIRATLGVHVTLSQVADLANFEGVPEYPKDETMLQECLQLRKAELEERAAKGDRFAQAVLSGESEAEDHNDGR